MFCNAAGPLSGKEHEGNIPVVRDKPLIEVLSEARLHHDAPINTAFKGFSIPAADLSRRMVVRYRPSDTDLPSWVKALWKCASDASREPPSEIIVVRLNAGDGDLGLFAVDRNWDDLGLIEADEAALESFGRMGAARSFCGM